MKAGLESSEGNCVIIIDADLQHPPHLILKMLEYYEQGYNQVIAKRSRKGEKLVRKWVAKFYYKTKSTFKKFFQFPLTYVVNCTVTTLSLFY